MTGHDFKLKRSLSVPIENRNVSKWLPIPFDTIRKKRINRAPLQTKTVIECSDCKSECIEMTCLIYLHIPYKNHYF